MDNWKNYLCILILLSGVASGAINNAFTGYLWLTGDEQEFRQYNGSNYLAFKASSSLAANYTWIWPVDIGSTGQQLQVTVSGNTATLSFEAAGGGGGAGDIDSVGDAASGAAFSADGTGNSLWFEGSSADGIETILTAADPATSDKTVTLRDASGTVIISGDTLAGDVTATFDTDGSHTTALANDTVAVAEFLASQDWGDVSTDADGLVTVDADSVALTTDTTGNYAAGDGEAGAATTGDSATAFFGAGTIEHERGGLEADVSGYTDGLYGMASGVTADIDTITEIETAIGGSTNILIETEIDASSELYALMDDETGSGAGSPLLVFNQAPTIDSPTFTTAITATDLVDSAHYVADSIDNEHVNWADIDNLDNEGAIIVADTTDATSFVALWESATGSLAAKSDAGITYDASTGSLTPTAIDGCTLGSNSDITELDVDDLNINGNVIKVVGNPMILEFSNEGHQILLTEPSTNEHTMSPAAGDDVALGYNDGSTTTEFESGAFRTLVLGNPATLDNVEIAADTSGTDSTFVFEESANRWTANAKAIKIPGDSSIANLVMETTIVFKKQSGETWFQFMPGADQANGFRFFEDSADGENRAVGVYGQPTGEDLKFGYFQITDSGSAEEFTIGTDAAAVIIPEVFYTTETVWLEGAGDDDVAAKTPIDLYIAGDDGQVGYNSSSERFKENIQVFTDYDILYLLEPKCFTRIDSNTPDIGLIAEDLDALNINETIPNLVAYERRKVVTIEEEIQDVLNDPCDPDSGTHEVVYENEIESYETTDIPASINYSRLVVPLLAELQKLKARVEELEKEK